MVNRLKSIINAQIRLYPNINGNNRLVSGSEEYASLILSHETSHPKRGIFSDIKIKEIDVAHMVVFVGPKPRSAKFWFGDPQNTAVNLGIADLG